MTIEGYVIAYKYDGRYEKVSLAEVPKGEATHYVRLEGPESVDFQVGAHVTIKDVTQTTSIKGTPLYEKAMKTDTTYIKKTDDGEIQAIKDVIPEVLPVSWSHRLELAGLVLILAHVSKQKPSECLQEIQDLALVLYSEEEL